MSTSPEIGLIQRNIFRIAPTTLVRASASASVRKVMTAPIPIA